MGNEGREWGVREYGSAYISMPARLQFYLLGVSAGRE